MFRGAPVAGHGRRGGGCLLGAGRREPRLGRLRLIFVADEIPAELRRVIEFLNEQMRPAEVLGVGIRHYTDEAQRVRNLVPRVVGRTPGRTRVHHGRGVRSRSSGRSRQGAARGRQTLLVSSSNGRAFRDSGLTWTRTGTFIPGDRSSAWGGTSRPKLLAHSRCGPMDMSRSSFTGLSRRPPFDDVGLRREFVRRVNEPSARRSRRTPSRVSPVSPRRPCRQPGGARFLQGRARLVLRDGAIARRRSRRGLART